MLEEQLVDLVPLQREGFGLLTPVDGEERAAGCQDLLTERGCALLASDVAASNLGGRSSFRSNPERPSTVGRMSVSFASPLTRSLSSNPPEAWIRSGTVAAVRPRLGYLLDEV